MSFLCHQLSKIAQAWANTWAKRTADENNANPHNPNRCDAGENVYEAGVAGLGQIEKNASHAVDVWYNEIEHYDFTKGATKDGKVVGTSTFVPSHLSLLYY